MKGPVARMGALYQEHLYLGATFAPSDEGDVMRVSSYPSEKGAGFDPKAAYLADLTGSTYELISGDASQALAEAFFCGKKLAVGECSWEASLTAEGALTSVPLVGRTGQGEYVVLDPSPRGDVASAWLGFISSIEQGGYAPYAQAQVEDATDMLTPLLLAGHAARAVLTDYVEHPRDLPAPGSVRNVRLDRIPTVSMGIGLPGAPELPAYVLLVPAAQAATLWRSFLSFSEVEPVGSGALGRALRSLTPWGDDLFEKDQVKPGADRLSAAGLLRTERDFIGARAL